MAALEEGKPAHVHKRVTLIIDCPEDMGTIEALQIVTSSHNRVTAMDKGVNFGISYELIKE